MSKSNNELLKAWSFVEGTEFEIEFLQVLMDPDHPWREQLVKGFKSGLGLLAFIGVPAMPEEEEPVKEETFNVDLYALESDIAREKELDDYLDQEEALRIYDKYARRE